MQWLIFCPPRLNSYLTTLQIKYNQVSNLSCVPTFLRNEPDFTDSRTIESLLTFYRGRTSKKKKRRGGGGGVKSISCRLCLPRGSAYRGRSTDKAKLICKSFSIRGRDRSLIDIPSVHRCLGYRLGAAERMPAILHPEKKWWSWRKKTIRDLRVGMNKIASSDDATASISDPYLARFLPLPFQYSAYFSLLTQPCRGRGASRGPDCS